MTFAKLYQWLIGVGLFLSVWLAIIFDPSILSASPITTSVIQVLPLYVLIVFACYSLAVIGYRVATFNDCEQAAKELKMEIKAAKKDLEARGFKFSDC